MASKLTPRSLSFSPLLASRRIIKPASAPLLSPLVRRTMATSSSPSTPARTYEWLVVIPDKPGVRAKRLEVRPTHFAGINGFVEKGIYKMGGALLDEVPEDDDSSKFKFAGSTVVCVAESREEIMGWLENDIYNKAGVWDLEKTQMWPFKCAFRHP